MKEYEFTVLLTREEDGRYTVICPSLEGCYSQGNTEAEALDMIRDAIRLHIVDRLANKEPVPPEVTVSKIRVAV